MGVLPARSARCQNCLPEYVAILCRGGCPILSDRAPRVTKAFFISVPVLRNDGCDPLWVSHCQTEAGGRAIVEHIDCVAADLECPCEGVNRERESIEGVRILPLRRNFGESETRK